MRPSHTLDRLDTAFDDDRLVANAGLLLPATLAVHLGLRDLVNDHLDLGDKPGRANRGDKLLLVMSALAGGDCIDDADALRAGGTGRILGFTVKAASTLGGRRPLRLGLNHLPSAKFAANGAWLPIQVIAHNLARWTARVGLGEGIVTTKTLRRLFGLVGRLTRSARRLTFHLPARWPWAIGWSTALARVQAIPLLA
jgi:hypothetical protein